MKVESKERPSSNLPFEVKFEELRHENKMIELEYERETIKLKLSIEKENARKIHEWHLEVERIKRAESRKDDRSWLERQKELHLFKKENWDKYRTPK